MKEQIKQVRDFQQAFEQPVNKTPELGNKYNQLLRFKLMKEENEEYLEAAEQNDLVEVLDALVDQAYVLFGAVNYHGLQDVFEQAFNRVHQNNMTKLVDGKPLKNKEGKVIKPEGFVPVSLEDLI